MCYKNNKYLVGIKEVKFYFRNKKNIYLQNNFDRRKKICFEKNKDNYSLIRVKCKKIFKKINI